MKTYWNEVTRFDNLYRGLKKSCQTVRWKDSVVGYENNALRNTLNLQRDLIDGTYQLQKYQHFTIYEPKKREIIATRLRDRQFQRTLCDCGLYEDITEHFINDNVACQRGKGTDYAIKRLKTHLHRYYRKHGNHGWVLKCDIHHFFQSTSHDVAKQAISKYVSDKDAIREVYKVIDSFEVGIGLGSEISQLIELLVLNDLDHYIKEKLHIKYYIRYMDDFVLIHNDKEYLKKCYSLISEKLADIHLELNKKTDLHKLEQGINFLRWKFILTDTGKVLMLFDKSKISRERKRLVRLLKKEANGEIPMGTSLQSLQCWLASAKRGDTYKIRKNMTAFYNNRLEVIYSERGLSQETIRRIKCNQCN